MKKIKYILAFALLVIFAFINNNKTYAAGNDKPRVVITSFEITNNAVLPGGDAEVKVKLKNTNETMTVYGVVLSYRGDNENVFVKYGYSNQAYFKSIAAGEEVTATFNLSTDEALDKSMINLSLNLIYKDDLNGENISESIISLPVKKDALSIKRITIPQKVTIGAKARISVTCENNSDYEAYNSNLIIEADGKEVYKDNLGTIIKGGRKNPEVYLEFLEKGTKNIKISISYSDAKGQTYVKTSEEYKLDVTEDSASKDKTNETDEFDSELISKKQVMYLIGTALFGVLSVIVLVKKRKG